MNDEIQTVEVTVPVGKELSETFSFLAKIIGDIKAGKAVAELYADLPLLVAAVQGYDKMPDELKSQVAEDTIALGMAKMTKALRGKQA